MLVLAMRVQVRMRMGNLAVLVAMGVDEVGAQKQVAIREYVGSRTAGGEDRAPEVEGARLKRTPL